MRIRAAVLLSAVLLASGTSWSQDSRLKDVAGSIKLNPEAIVEKQGIVEDPLVAERADGGLFETVLAECSAVAHHLAKLVDEARNTILYRDNDLPNRLEGASRELERQIQDLYLLRLSESFAEPVGTAREAADICAAACVSVREELALGGVAFTVANQEVTTCVQGLEKAKTQFATAANLSAVKSAAPAAPTTTEPPAPLTDDEIIAARCEPERSKGPDAFDACQAGQYRALAAISSRSVGNEMLVEAIFSGIRGICVELYPQDFVQREACEVEKMTAARMDQE